MHAVAGRTVGNTLRSAAKGETVVAVGEGWNPVGGQIVAQGEAFIGMAATAGSHRNARCVHQRSCFLRAQDKVLAVAVDADRRLGQAVLCGLSVNALQICLGNVGMALSTGRGDIEMVDLGTRILRGQDAVAAMAIGARRGGTVSVDYGSSMHALAIELYGMCEGNFVA